MSRPQGFSPRVKQIVFERSGGVCERCGNWHDDLQFHHRRPRGAGGSKREDTNQPANCLHVGAACHAAIESNRAEAYEYGWLVRQHQTPADIPVLRRGLWALLDDTGDYTVIPEPETA